VTGGGGNVTGGGGNVTGGGGNVTGGGGHGVGGAGTGGVIIVDAGPPLDGRVPKCGDAIVDPGEECDLGVTRNTGSYGGCTATCKLAPYCGDGVVNPTEQCDFGKANNNGAYGGCTADCRLGPHCGDGVVNGQEICDAGSPMVIAVGKCKPDCSGLIGSRLIRATGFVSAALNGISGADGMCATMFGGTGVSYKALLVDGHARVATVSPNTGDGQVDWVLQKYTQYVNGDGKEIFLTDDAALLGVRAKQNVGILVPIPTVIDNYGAFLGVNNNWVASNKDESAGITNCQSWKSTAAAESFTGPAAGATTAGTFPDNGGTSSCANQAHLYCVQQ
jgi:cysteine-rich repeat protein